MDEAADRPDVVIHPPVALVIAVVAALAAQYVSPLRLFSSPGFFALGWGFVAAGLTLAAPALWLFRRAGTSVPTFRPTSAIVTGGPYRIIRNPIYVGMLCEMLGAGLVFDNAWLAFLAAPLALVLHFGVVLREEEYLQKKFGAAYLDYKARSRRWL